MRVIELDLGEEDTPRIPKRMKGSVFIDHQSLTVEEIYGEIDALLSKHGLRIVLGNTGALYGYLVQVEKK